jgi:hypothetical protein
MITTGQGLITTEHRTIIKQRSTITNGQGEITPSASTPTKRSVEMNTNGYTLFARLPGQPRTASDSTGFKAYVLVWHITAYDRYRPFEPYLPEKVKNQRLILANPPQSLAEKWRGWK